MEFSEIQLGIDLATSATIIFSGAAFWSQYLRATKEVRRSDKIEKTRSTALARLYEVSREFEDAYMELLDVHRSINLKAYGSPYGAMLRYIPVEGSERTLEDYQSLVTGFQRFAYLVFKRRYTLLPLLEVIDEEGGEAGGEAGQARSTIWADISQLKIAEMRLSREYDYLHHLVKLHTQVIAELGDDLSVTNENLEDVASTLYQAHPAVKEGVNWILTDANFRSFVRDFYAKLELPPEDSKEMASYLDGGFRFNVSSEKLARFEAILARAANELLVSLIRGGGFSVIGRAGRVVDDRLNESTLICKEILIKISALLSKTLRNGSDVSFNDLVARYEDDKYLSSTNMHG